MESINFIVNDEQSEVIIDKDGDSTLIEKKKKTK